MKIQETLETKFDEEMIDVVGNNVTPKTIAKEIVKSGKQEDAFYIMDVGDVAKNHEIWTKYLPNVKPYYAVKCNDSLMVLRILASMGTGFDCASKGEISRVLSLGVSPDRIIFANPTKPASHIRFAQKIGVDMMTFDSATELLKIKELHPRAKLILRIRVDSFDAQCPLGMKFGADMSAVSGLISLAAEINADVIGVSFHVGSGCRELSAFSGGIRTAREILEEMSFRGLRPSLLDIGGGFTKDTFYEAARWVKEALSDLDPEISLIAEPGRFFVESAYTLVTLIHGKRGKEYYINDGVYGSFNCVLYDHATPQPHALQNNDSELQKYKVWGPTCDSLDLVTEDALLPNLDIGDWLIWEKMGAYTLAVASNFNGFPIPKVHYFTSEEIWQEMKKYPGFFFDKYNADNQKRVF